MEFFTGQCRTVDLSAGSLCPPLVLHNIHRSSAVHQARVSRKSGELWIILSFSCCPVHWFHPPLFQYAEWTAAKDVLMHQSKLKNSSLMRWEGDVFNSWLASNHISLCDNFLLISTFPAYHAPLIFPYFICIFCILKVTLNLKLSQTAHINWTVFPSWHVFTATDLYPLETDAVFPSGERMETLNTWNTQDRLSGYFMFSYCHQIEFACSLCVCVGSLRVLNTVQGHACIWGIG